MTRISTRLSILILAAALAADALAVTIDTVPVGNPGNANDPSDGDSSNPHMQNLGRVDYSYRIGRTEVTIGQYCEFLNAVADDDTYSLYNTAMGTFGAIKGITRSGASGNYAYSVIGDSANHPIAFVNWGDAARFSNWLQNGQPIGGQDASTTERGAYTLDGATGNLALEEITRNADAKWFIPSENEWYKAAYYQPSAEGGDSDNYWAYPTRTNIEPNSDQPSGDPSIQDNVANFFRNDSLPNGYNDGYAVTGSTGINGTLNYLTDVGAYAFAPSYYGTFDQGGNLTEWTDTIIPGDVRVGRGGDYFRESNRMHSSYRFYLSSSGSGNEIGFRVATIPEPSTAMLAILGMIGISVAAYRRRYR